MLKVLCNGCFDVLHIGHVEHLEQAKSMGDTLIVALTEDHMVNKGPDRPFNIWSDRAKVLIALESVDQVIQTSSACEAIRTVKPDIFVKGIDYIGGDNFTEDVKAACYEVGAEIRYTDTVKRSASEIIRKIRGNDHSTI